VVADFEMREEAREVLCAARFIGFRRLYAFYNESCGV